MDSFLPLDLISIPLVSSDNDPGSAFLSPPTPDEEDSTWDLPIDFEHSSGASGSPKFFCIIA